MSDTSPSDATQLLKQTSNGDADSRARLLVLMYDRFHQMAAHYLQRERSDHTLQPTALVHELYLKLIDQRNVDWKDQSHFFALGARAMRQILVDYARRRGRDKRGGGWLRIPLDESLSRSREQDVDVLDLEDALEKLARQDPRLAAVVEMRFFGHLTVEEVAQAMGRSKRSVEEDWTFARAWLRREWSDAASQQQAAPQRHVRHGRVSPGDGSGEPVSGDESP